MRNKLVVHAVAHKSICSIYRSTRMILYPYTEAISAISGVLLLQNYIIGNARFRLQKLP